MRTTDLVLKLHLGSGFRNH